jgi:hypothetical protein
MLKELKITHTVGSGFNKTHPTPTQRIYYAERAINRHAVPDTRAKRQQRFKDIVK